MASLAAARTAAFRWIDETILDLGRQMRWSYLPPLMVYLAAGVSGLTSIVGTFYIKEHFDLSAAFLSGLTFWAGLPWAFKMPLGHLVDLMWRRKAALVYLGATLIALSLAIMYGLIVATPQMAAVMSVEAWYVISTMLAPIGYALQDVVADAMTVEAVPTLDAQGHKLPEDTVKAMHTTMQLLGRIAIIAGLFIVSGMNVLMFAGVESMSDAEKTATYADMYLLALAIPVVSVAGVTLGAVTVRLRAARLRRQGVDPGKVEAVLGPSPGETKIDWWILGGGAVFAVFTLAVGLSGIRFNEEIVFAGSMAIVLFLMRELLQALAPAARGALVGTAVIIFVFRSTPLPGPGATWWEIDVLGFDQQFLSVLTLITSALGLAGMIALRPFMAHRSIADVVIVLSIAAGIISLPIIGLYYGIQDVTARWSGGIVDARFIAILDTALESPLGQISMIPMLAWIAKNAPADLKATFFAVMASFTNLALSASSLWTKYLNEIFVVEREVRDPVTNAITTPADYSELGLLLITVNALTLIVPLITIAIVQRTRLRTTQ